MSDSRLPSYSIGATGPQTKIHLFDRGVCKCSQPQRRPRGVNIIADIPLGQMTPDGLAEIVARLNLDSTRLCRRCFAQRVRDAIRPSIA